MADPKALNWILSTNFNSFPRPQSSQNISANLIGKGLVYHFGDVHRRQRKVIGSAFLPIHLKKLTPVFWKKSLELVKVLEEDEDLKGKYEGKVVEVQVSCMEFCGHNVSLHRMKLPFDFGIELLFLLSVSETHWSLYSRHHWSRRFRILFQ